MKRKVNGLTEHEYELVGLAAQGLTNQQIASVKDIKVGTVDNLFSNGDRGIYQKIPEVKCRAQLITWYLRTEYQFNYLCNLEVLNITQRWASDIRLIGHDSFIIPRIKESYLHYWGELESFINFPGYKPFLIKVAQLLYLEGMAHAGCSLPNEIINQMNPVVEKLKYIATTCNDGEILGLAYHFQGLSYYISKMYKKANKYLSLALDYLTSVEHRLHTLRALAIVLGYLQLHEERERIEKQALEILKKENPTLEVVCMTLEGLGRSQLLVDLPVCFEILQAARETEAKMRATNQVVPLRLLQIDRTEVEAIQRFGIYKELLELYAGDGLQIAMRNSYPRHGWEIETALGVKRSCLSLEEAF